MCSGNRKFVSAPAKFGRTKTLLMVFMKTIENVQNNKTPVQAKRHRVSWV
jgi:hypothetical protein